MAIINFDASQVEPMKPQETIPAGWYDLQIVKSDMKPTKDGTGFYLEIEMEVMSGEHAKRKLFDRFNLQNNNPAAVEIAYKQLSAVCHAVGVIQCQDSSQLHGRPFSGKVKLIPAGPGNDGKMYDAKNEMGGYKAIGNNAAATGSGPAPAWASQPAPAQAPQQAPWQPAPAQQPQAPAQHPWQNQPPTQQQPQQAPWVGGPSTPAAVPANHQFPPFAPQAHVHTHAAATAPAAAPTPPWAQAGGAGSTPPWAAK